MLNLLITTSTKLASISLYQDNNMLGNININVKKTHSTYIINQIESLFNWTQKSIDDVNNVVVSIGPGSFTGVRISIAIIKAMFVYKEVDIYEVNELDAMAYQIYKLYNKDIISIIDANKEKIYYGIYKQGNRYGDLKVSKLDELIEFIGDKEYILVGDATINYRYKLEKLPKVIIPKLDSILVINSCIFNTMLLEGMLKKVDVFNLKPDYLEKSQAEKEKYNV